MKVFQLSVLVFLMAVSEVGMAQQRWSSSLYLQPQTPADVMVPFSVGSVGRSLPVRWGLDVAWISESNMKKGINFIGKDNLSIARGSFQTTYPLLGDSALTSSQISTLRQRMALVDLMGNKIDVVLNEDQEAGIVNYYVKDGVADVGRWARLIDASVAWVETNTRHKVVAVSPFNEPDYSSWGQGSLSDFKEIARTLKEGYPRFADIAITGGNTLNCDQASSWYNGLKPYVSWGNTHQLAGSFDSYANFFSEVTADGNYAYADELHNVGEAMVGAEYGMKCGIWWGFDSRARGEFCRISNSGRRIGYAENRGAWTAASVYQDTATAVVKAFIGSSERQAVSSSFLFVSKDRDVYFDGQGPTREFYMHIPGGTGYQRGQTNAERVIDITSGEDVPPAAINGRYKLMNRATGYLASIFGTKDGHTNIAQQQEKNLSTQLWTVGPVPERVNGGGDYSFYNIQSASNGAYMNVLDNSKEAGANVISYDAGGASNEQWYLQYAGEGYYYILNRESGLYLTVESTNKSDGVNILQFSLLPGTRSQRQQWMLVPDGVTAEQKAPAMPQGLTAQSQNASVALSWTANSDADLDGYMILRATAGQDDWNVIARKVESTAYVDNACRQWGAYDYKIKAIDRAGNLSKASAVVTASATGGRGLVADYTFEDSLQDASVNMMDGVSADMLLTKNAHNGAYALFLNGNNHVRLPYEIADMGAMTVSAWVNWRASSLVSWSRIFDFGNGTDAYMYLTPSNGSNMRFAIKNGGDEQAVDCKQNLSRREWVHVAVTIGGGQAVVYVNGEEAGRNRAVSIKPSDVRPVFNYLGRSQFSADPLFTGYIDDLRIYNYAMTADEVRQDMTVTDGIHHVVSQPESDHDMPSFNLEGQRVGDSYRGIVIFNGKKIVRNNR